jgi:hypothetical protein
MMAIRSPLSIVLTWFLARSNPTSELTGRRITIQPSPHQ